MRVCKKGIKNLSPHEHFHGQERVRPCFLQQPVPTSPGNLSDCPTPAVCTDMLKLPFILMQVLRTSRQARLLADR